MLATNPFPAPGRVPACTTPSPHHLSLLQDVFGLASFRGRQYEVVTAILNRQDSLVILPTSAGKSLCFQFPPYAHGNAFIVVVGPLIALMKDQVNTCIDKGIEAAVFNSECQEVQKQSLLRDIVSNEPAVRLLYTTPESLQQPRLREALQEACGQGTLLAFAIDEAHCISEWGTSFRPAYLTLSNLKDDFPNVPVVALTASCTSQVQTSIISLLKLKEPAVIKSSFNRPNIQYIIRYKELLGGGTNDDTLQDLVSFIQSRPEDCGIIYARTRASCDWLTKSLQDLDMDVECYHAGRDAGSRARVQREWSDKSINVVVATIAFGMGIDRADVRWVVHWDCPTSMEGFYQQSGRAGRDGLASMSVVYTSRSDIQAAVRMSRGSASDGPARLGDMCMNSCCRRRAVLKYFDEHSGPCTELPGSIPCDFCTDPAAVRRALAALDKQEQHTSLAAAVRSRQGGGGSDPGEADVATSGVPVAENLDASVGSAGHMQLPAMQQLAHKRGWWSAAGDLLQDAGSGGADGAGIGGAGTGGAGGAGVGTGGRVDRAYAGPVAVAGCAGSHGLLGAAACAGGGLPVLKPWTDIPYAVLPASTTAGQGSGVSAAVPGDAGGATAAAGVMRVPQLKKRKLGASSGAGSVGQPAPAPPATQKLSESKAAGAARTVDAVEVGGEVVPAAPAVLPLQPLDSNVSSVKLTVSRSLYRQPFNPPKRVSAGCGHKP